ncbi:MAG: GAF domain-containing sensor histidine kinase, partial [Acidimicrobiia bacterium]|nr:GAF domain-containing sensor histidine kinase [Acidimicrobiia bacterium]
ATGMELTGAAYGALGVLGEHGALIQFVHAGFDPEIPGAIGAPPQGRGLLGIISEMGKTVRIDRISDHPDFAGFPRHHPSMETFLGMPVTVGGETFGNLYLTEKPGGFTADDEALAEALAAIAGSAIATSRMHGRLRRAAVVEDRERIARDLHDAIIQDLFAVGLSLQSLGQKVENTAVKTSLTESVQRLDEAISSLRKFIFDLRPPVWTRRSLKGELSDLVGQLAEPYKASIDLAVTGEINDLPAEVVSDVVQVVREATNNALRHSGVGRVTVSVHRGADRLVITVADRGRGFDPDTVERGMGLDNLRARARDANGDTEIISRAGFGTTVRVILPA